MTKLSHKYWSKNDTDVAQMSQEQRTMNDTDDVSETESPRYLTALSTSEKKTKKTLK